MTPHATKCVVEAGSMVVEDDCCTDVGPQFGLVRDAYPSTCFVISGLLGEDGGSLQSYLGCDDGFPKYGEACYEEGADSGGIVASSHQVQWLMMKTPPPLKNVVVPFKCRAMGATRFVTFPSCPVSKTTRVKCFCG